MLNNRNRTAKDTLITNIFRLTEDPRLSSSLLCSICFVGWTTLSVTALVFGLLLVVLGPEVVMALWVVVVEEGDVFVVVSVGIVVRFTMGVVTVVDIGSEINQNYWWDF